jgi:hypothetical protein
MYIAFEDGKIWRSRCIPATLYKPEVVYDGRAPPITAILGPGIRNGARFCIKIPVVIIEAEVHQRLGN